MPSHLHHGYEHGDTTSHAREWAPSDLPVVAWLNALDLPALSGCLRFGSVLSKVPLQRQKCQKVTKMKENIKNCNVFQMGSSHSHPV